MRKSTDDVWIFLPDARTGSDDSCGGHRYRYGVLYDVLSNDGQTTGDQIDSVCQDAARLRLVL